MIGQPTLAPSSWPFASDVPPLLADEVHVWLARVPELGSQHGAFLAVLDDEERARLERLHRQGDRTRYLVVRGALRLLLARYLAHDAAALRFVTDGRGKPHLLHPAGRALRFNVSHSGELALLALTSAGDVGVDIEQWPDAPDLAQIERTSERVLSRAERGALRALPPAERAPAFFALWARKEAYLKALGTGVAAGLDHFDVSIADGPSCLLADRRDPAAPSEWTVRGLALGPGCSGAIAIRARTPVVMQLSLSLRDRPDG